MLPGLPGSGSVRFRGFLLAYGTVAARDLMSETVDLSGQWRRLMAMPPIGMADLAGLAEEFDLTIDGPDGDGFVYALISDPISGLASGHLIGAADSPEAMVWLAWRDRDRAH